ncbi:MAG: DUF3472 domain-containing protein [Prevotellaceae bacterium]|jgi:hypothetical protein|nr:DUF3472 domain-containing protein [Prevotellaceae bacterium]
MNYFIILLLSLFAFTASSQHLGNSEHTVEVPLQGNTYTTSGPNAIDRNGRLRAWDKPATVLSTYFRVSSPGSLKLSLKYTAQSESAVKISCLGRSYEVKFVPAKDTVIHLGDIEEVAKGYIKMDFQGISTSGKDFGNIRSILIDGKVTRDKPMFVNKPDYHYWGRRGPSVHIGYTLPSNNVEWFYNEVTVPEGSDPIGSYFMSNGFGEGYFGMQVNSETERRVLFSVWSPYKTDNPKEIPDDEQVLLNRKGEGVTSQAFGGEGSGRQNFMTFAWKAGVTYKFLTHIVPDPDRNGYTRYTCWLFNPDDSKWMLIASNSRPKTNKYYSHSHSFLENFNPSYGYISRKVFFGNMWSKSAGEDWKEVTTGKFTHDATASAEQRMDYQGGVEDGKFFLRNCGFFSEYTKYGSIFTRNPEGKKPKIDLDKLP